MRKASFAAFLLALCLLALPALAAELPQLPEPQALRLPGGLRLTVYQGPGPDYGIAGNGEAYASSNGPIEAFGRLGDWLLVRYHTARDHQRYGFISARALDRSQLIPELHFAEQEGYALRDTPVSDVLWRDEELMPQGRQQQALAPLTPLARLGERFALAQIADEGGYVRYLLIPLDAVKLADPRARLNDKPAWWYGDFAPESFWQALDQSGYQQNRREDLLALWGESYGYDEAFWPLPQQAISYLLHVDLVDLKEPLAGLPLAGDISQEEALAIAEKAVTEAYPDELSALPLSDYEISYGFKYNQVKAGDRVWQVWFADPVAGNAQGLKFRVDIDATNGEVLTTHLEEKGNG